MEVVRKMEVTMNHRNLKVLVADDEQIIADTLKLILDKSGYVTRAAYSGETAVEMARGFEPDMLITDVIMPGMSGIEAAIQVRTDLPSCKVLLFSGNEATADLVEAALAQNHKFELLAKPVHPTELLAKMRIAMNS
jgi:CheY-like chemotaxis protein